MSLFLFLSMGISSLLKSSAASLVSLILLWAILIVVVPQTSYIIGVRSVEPVGAWWEKANELSAQVTDQLQTEGVAPRGRDLGQVDDYALERRYTQRVEDMEGEQGALVRSLYRQMLQQYEVGRTVNLLSPGMAFQYGLEAVLGAGVQRYEALLTAAWRFRADLRDFIRARDAADPESPHVLYLSGYVSDRQLDPADIPRFAPPPGTLTRQAGSGSVQIAVLLLEAALAFFFAQWAFHRMDLVDG
jgi:ABC-type transport system involved in multi-copper enzyme maturation permease subunit